MHTESERRRRFIPRLKSWVFSPYKSYNIRLGYPAVRDELKRLKTSPQNSFIMSQATKVVLGVIGAAVVVGLLLLVGIVLL